jgi:CheY-like chemotaxis protein
MANERSEPAGGRTILAVDDEADLLEAVRRILSRLGHRVIAAGGPAEAMELWMGHSGDIDLLLTDVRMPGGTGTDLAHQLCQLQPGLPVLFMSGLYDIPGTELSGPVQVVAKPFTPTSLAEAVDHALLAKAGH